MSDLDDKLRKIVAAKLNTSESRLQPDTTFMMDLGADESDLSDVASAIGNELGITIPNEEMLANLRTYGALSDYVHKNS